MTDSLITLSFLGVCVTLSVVLIALSFRHLLGPGYLNLCSQLGPCQSLVYSSEQDLVGVAFLPSCVSFTYSIFNELDADHFIEDNHDSPLLGQLPLSIEGSQDVSWKEFEVLKIKAVRIWLY